MINSSQKVVSKLFYALISQLSPGERRGAVQAMSLLVTAVEESYLKTYDDKKQLQLDFYEQCYTVLTGVALALKMAEDDGLLPAATEVNKAGLPKSVREADAAFERIEQLLKRLVSITTLKPH